MFTGFSANDAGREFAVYYCDCFAGVEEGYFRGGVFDWRTEEEILGWEL